MAGLSGQEIVCISPTDWDVHWGPQHQIMSRLAIRNRVLFVELPFSPLSFATGLRRLPLSRLRRSVLLGAPRVETNGLLVASPPPVLPFRYNKLSNWSSQAILRSYLSLTTRRLRMRGPILITFQADSGALIRRSEARARIYYCTDDWASLERWWQPAARVRQREAELVRACDLVIATSRRLANRLQALGTPTHCLPNAVDEAMLCTEIPRSLPPALAGLGRPIVGFAGIIHRHSFDADLLLALGKSHPEWTFLMVGRQEGREPDLGALRGLPNFVFAGFQERAVLPAYLAAMDVCLIPRPNSEWAQSAFSLKLFEYLAAGKPVVATHSDEFVPFEPLVRQARTYAEFDTCCQRSLSEDNKELARQRVALARENTWARRIEQISEILSGAAAA